MPIKLLFGVVFAFVLVVSGSSTKRYRYGYSNAARQRLFGRIPIDEGIENDNLGASTPPNGIDSTEKSYETCTSSVCTLQAESLRLTMNPTADPCEDFYDYACGGWTAFWEAYIRSGNINVDKFKVPEALLNLHERNILGKKIKPTDIKPIRSAKMFYQSCLRAGSQEEAPALRVVKKILDRSNGWPMATEQSDATNIKWQPINDNFIRTYGIDSMYKISLHVPYEADNEPSIRISEPSKSWTLEQVYSKNHSEERQKEIADAATFFAKLSDQNVSRENIQRDAAEIVHLEKKMFKITTESVEDSQDSEMSVDELQREYDKYRSNHYNSKIDWLKTIQYCFIGTKIRVEGNTTINMTKKFSKYLRKLAEILDETPRRTLVNYVYWRMISQVAGKVYPYVNEIPGDASARWFHCVRRHPMTHAIWYAFASTNYISKDIASATYDLVTSVQNEVAQQILHSGWMDESTKQAATKKLLAMEEYVGFTDFDINEEAVIRYYKGLVLTEDYEQNILNWIEWTRTKDLERSIISIAIEKRIYPVELNAFYISLTNSIYIPAWIMKFSLIGPEAPESISLGTIGAVIGHEISHAFDSRGIHFDENGDRADLPRDVETTYTKKSQCFEDQYSNYPIPELSSTKPVYVDGYKTLAENIADSTGLSAAFGVLSENMKRKDFKDLRLPGLENLTAEQLFFLSYGNMWCAEMTNSTLALLNAKDEHTTRHVRVNGAVSNSEEFDEAFNCPVGSKMNPKKKCNIWN